MCISSSQYFQCLCILENAFVSGFWKGSRLCTWCLCDLTAFLFYFLINKVQLLLRLWPENGLWCLWNGMQWRWCDYIGFQFLLLQAKCLWKQCCQVSATTFWGRSYAFSWKELLVFWHKHDTIRFWPTLVFSTVTANSLSWPVSAMYMSISSFNSMDVRQLLGVRQLLFSANLQACSSAQACNNGDVLTDSLQNQQEYFRKLRNSSQYFLLNQPSAWRIALILKMLST